ncbi:16S rRNA (uracil(1498)-N(3))-methyltransferase [Microbacterium sp. STN6]|uniref:16S rRNA (uracil(1498)-N(3))-methyltransferase n=1 Tax=Microbacterium sp. STN6 TaxID=2995588 RepID=UPI0022608EB1|nr:16S rRNA (uracil(1498)-N(3))-methyltransferase [Microbacterium sp. STN6]MCX7522307.1 16S rRNA (uracil(1498)-N(3))-methyltransferase [Microbacterium sp. STN6]
MSSLYLRDDLEAPGIGDTIALTGAEAKHAASVNRLRRGESVLVGNGRGLLVTAVATAVSPSVVELEVTASRTEPQPSQRVTLVQALAKGGRDELAIQAATELGVDEVVPWAAARSVSRWEGQKVERGRERWATIVREASKQSIRSWVPAVGPLAHTGDLVASRASRVLVLEPTALTRLSSVEADGRNVTLVVGPEGGIAPNELSALTDAGAEAVRLGDTVLRTSTAGPAALALISAVLGRW